MKSLLVIGALGFAGCLVLSLSMKQLVEHRQAVRQGSCAPALEAAFGPQLAGPVAVREENEGEHVRWCVHARAAAGQDRTRLALAMGQLVWRSAAGAADRPAEVLVTLRDAAGQDPLATRVPPPVPAR